MKYFAQQTSFYKKALPAMLLINIVPAIFFGMYTVPFGSVHFLKTYFSANISNFYQVLKIVFEGDNFIKVYPLVIMTVAIILFFSLGVGIIEKYLRIGHISLARPISSINITIIPTIVFISLVIFVIYIQKIVLSSLIIIFHLIISGMGNVANPATMAVVSTLSIVLPIVASGLFLWILMLLPAMTISGYTFRDSVLYSIRLAYKDFWSLLLSLMIPLLVAVAIEFASSYLVASFILQIIRTILFVLIFGFVEIFMMLSFDKLR